jgi:putative ABC transport system ATP-binding protein
VEGVEDKKAMNKTIIEVKNLKKEFHVGDVIVRALKGVNLSIAEGEFIAIMGASGSGKSTMLNILGCLEKPNSGVYILDGVDMSKLNKDELANLRNQKLGFVFQSYNLLPRTSALENVELPLFYNNKIKAQERRERAEKALVAVGLKDRMDHMPNQLSGGQQQRVAIARSLVNDPVVILADEATGNLDTRTSFEIMALFQELNSQGKTIVFVTHEADIARFTSRNIVFRDGQILRTENVTERFNAVEMIKNLPVTDDAIPDEAVTDDIETAKS